MGNILQREGVDTHVSSMFYQEVVREVLFFSSDLWAMSEATERMVEVNHVLYLWNIMGKRARRTTNRTWETSEARDILRAA